MLKKISELINRDLYEGEKERLRSLITRFKPKSLHNLPVLKRKSSPLFALINPVNERFFTVDFEKAIFGYRVNATDPLFKEFYYMIDIKAVSLITNPAEVKEVNAFGVQITTKYKTWKLFTLNAKDYAALKAALFFIMGDIAARLSPEVFVTAKRMFEKPYLLKKEKERRQKELDEQRRRAEELRKLEQERLLQQRLREEEERRLRMLQDELEKRRKREEEEKARLKPKEIYNIYGEKFEALVDGLDRYILSGKVKDKYHEMNLQVAAPVGEKHIDFNPDEGDWTWYDEIEGNSIKENKLVDYNPLLEKNLLKKRKIKGALTNTINADKLHQQEKAEESQTVQEPPAEEPKRDFFILNLKLRDLQLEESQGDLDKTCPVMQRSLNTEYVKKPERDPSQRRKLLEELKSSQKATASGKTNLEVVKKDDRSFVVNLTVCREKAKAGHTQRARKEFSPEGILDPGKRLIVENLFIPKDRKLQMQFDPFDSKLEVDQFDRQQEVYLNKRQNLNSHVDSQSEVESKGKREVSYRRPILNESIQFKAPTSQVDNESLSQENRNSVVVKKQAKSEKKIVIRE